MRIKKYYSVIAHDLDNVELRHGAFNAISHFLNDEEKTGQLSKIISKIDGRSLDDIVKDTGISRSKIEGVVDRLIELGAIEDSANSALDAYYDRIIPSLRTTDSSLKSRMPVTIIGSRDIANQIEKSISRLTHSIDIEILEYDSDKYKKLDSLKLSEFDDAISMTEIIEFFSFLKGRLVIFPQLYVNPHKALVVNRLALAIGSPCLWGGVDGPSIFIGPFTLPEKSSCFQCFETRIMMNLREYVSYQRYKLAISEGLATGQSLPIEDALCHILIGHLAMEAVNFLVTGSAFTIGKSLCIYLPTMEFTFNDVLKLPYCGACAPKAYVKEPELYFDIRSVLAMGRT